MKEILYNLALIDTINFCKENGIDCSGTHLVKHPRKQTYALIKDVPGQKSTGWKLADVVVTVTFHKSQVPTHTWNKEKATEKELRGVCNVCGSSQHVIDNYECTKCQSTDVGLVD